jgi:myo-inositol-1(or 4)-monophosphatase
VVATGFPFRDKQRKVGRYLPAFEAALLGFEDLRRAGAASLDLAYTAAGVWEGFFELGLSIWDIAAGSLLVREAGGVVTDWRGDSRAVFVSGDILAGAPAWHATMLGLLSGLGAASPPGWGGPIT